MSTVHCRRVVTITFNTLVAGLEVSDEILAARLHAEQFRVWYGDGTALVAGTSAVDMLEHVSGAADLVVRTETASHPHAAVVGALHQDHLAVGAARIECLPLAVLTLTCNGMRTLFMFIRILARFVVCYAPVCTV